MMSIATTTTTTTSITTSEYLFENSRSFSYEGGIIGQKYVIGNIWKIFFTHGLPMTMIPLLFAIPFVTLLFFPIPESVDPIRIYLLVFVPSTTILAYFACAGSISYYVAMIYAGDVERIPSVIESIKRGIIKLGTIILFLFLFKIGCVV